MARQSFLVFGFLLLSILAIAQKKKRLQWLVPDHAKVQFAGGIGFLSAGLGYESKNKKFQTDFYYGYVPENVGGINIHSATGKLTWIPLALNLKRNFRLDILTTGLLINYAFGDQYFFLSPEYYPLKYYGVPSALHLGLFVGGGIRWKKLGAYYELGTIDRELSSYVTNARSLSFFDIWNLGIGLRYQFRDH
jgi:hypothetical protein